MELILTNHVCLRYIERINPQLAAIEDFNNRLMMAKQAINAIVIDAHYLSDDGTGVLLQSDTYKCKLIVSRRKIITIFPIAHKKYKGNIRRDDA